MALKSMHLLERYWRYARNIDNPGVLASAIERISQKHVGYAIHPEHYPHVATALLGAIKQVLGDVATSEVLEAWGEAYWFIANLLKDREAVIREGIMTKNGGWIHWRRFVISKRIPESETITSFMLHPEDGGPVVPIRPDNILRSVLMQPACRV